jgi:endonuclease/exonuclease/phosphatase family metal-dependent hydrolase
MSTGDYKVPEQLGQLFGTDHPFLEDMKEDLVRLCEHPNAGDIVILGWRKGVESLTFCTENGSHAGLTPEETNPFSLLPRHTQLPDNGKGYLRPLELRAAALHFLGRKLYETKPRYDPFINIRKGTLKVMTYNVHSCVGLDGKLDVARISRVIAQEQPDIVALQELDVGRARSGHHDQAELIAELLEMDYQFHPAMHLEEEQYGDAILTHLPLRTVKTGVLPGGAPGSKREPRGAIWVTVNFNGVELHVVNTHFGLSRSEKLLQAHTLMGNDWLREIVESGAPVILCGDFNAHPKSAPYKVIAASLHDVQSRLKQRPRNTFYSRFPSLRIDHIFVNDALEVLAVEAPRHRTAVTASDHLPLIAELQLVEALRPKGSGTVAS